MKRLLCIVGGMNVGGAETFLMKIYRTIDRTKYQMDFAVSIAGEGAYDAEIKDMGGRVFHITSKSKGLIRNFCDIKCLVKSENYKYVLRVSQNSLSALELLAAKIGGAQNRAFRSSNSNVGSASKKQLMVHKLCRFMPRLFANIRLAPSTEAAEFMFGKECVKKRHAKILHNGIDTSYYRYDERGRLSIRQEFGIPSTAVLVGNIGRFNQQKNHRYLLEIFKHIYEKNKNAILLLVGTGELERDIRNRVEEMGMGEKVIFAGVRSDVPNLLSAMDVFVMPSFYEGMPNTVIEAQATGLFCVISDTITGEANITGRVKYMSLDDDPSLWSNEIMTVLDYHRQSADKKIIESKYDIKSVTNEFVDMIFN